MPWTCSRCTLVVIDSELDCLACGNRAPPRKRAAAAAISEIVELCDSDYEEVTDDVHDVAEAETHKSKTAAASTSSIAILQSKPVAAVNRGGGKVAQQFEDSNSDDDMQSISVAELRRRKQQQQQLHSGSATGAHREEASNTRVAPPGALADDRDAAELEPSKRLKLSAISNIGAAAKPRLGQSTKLPQLQPPPPPRLGLLSFVKAAPAQPQQQTGPDSRSGFGSSIAHTTAAPGALHSSGLGNSPTRAGGSGGQPFPASSSSSAMMLVDALQPSAAPRATVRSSKPPAPAPKAPAFASKPSSSSSRAASAAAAGAASEQQGPTLSWIERNAPRTAADLAVHPKKVTELRQWLQHAVTASRGVRGLPGPPDPASGPLGGCSQPDPFAQFGPEDPYSMGLLPPPRLLIVLGPPGIGKSTAVRILAAEAGLRLREWVDGGPRGSVYSAVGLMRGVRGAGGAGPLGDRSGAGGVDNSWGTGTGAAGAGVGHGRRRGAGGEEEAEAASTGLNSFLGSMYERATRAGGGAHSQPGAAFVPAVSVLADFASFLGTSTLFPSLSLVGTALPQINGSRASQGRSTGTTGGRVPSAPTASSSSSAAAAAAPRPSGDDLLLVEDIPRSLSGDPEFGRTVSAALLRFLQSSRFPAVLIVSEGEAPGEPPNRPALSRLLGAEVVDHPSTTVLEVNPVPDGRMKKLLQKVCDAEAARGRTRGAAAARAPAAAKATHMQQRWQEEEEEGGGGAVIVLGDSDDSDAEFRAPAPKARGAGPPCRPDAAAASAGAGRPPHAPASLPPGAMDSIVATARGDLRHAIMSIEFLSSAPGSGSPPSGYGSLAAAASSRTAGARRDGSGGGARAAYKHRSGDADSFAFVPGGSGGGEEEGGGPEDLAPVHLCGRDDFLDSLHVLGRLLHGKRVPATGRLEYDPDTVVAGCPYDAPTTAAFLAENAPAFHTDIGELCGTLERLSFAEVLDAHGKTRGYSGSSSSGSTAAAVYPEQYVGAIAARAVSTHNAHPAPRTFRPTRKPSSFAVWRAGADNRRWLRVEGLGLWAGAVGTEEINSALDAAIARGPAAGAVAGGSGGGAVGSSEAAAGVGVVMLGAHRTVPSGQSYLLAALQGGGGASQPTTGQLQQQRGGQASLPQARAPLPQTRAPLPQTRDPLPKAQASLPKAQASLLFVLTGEKERATTTLPCLHVYLQAWRQQQQQQRFGGASSSARPPCLWSERFDALVDASCVYGRTLSVDKTGEAVSLIGQAAASLARYGGGKGSAASSAGGAASAVGAVSPGEEEGAEDAVANPGAAAAAESGRDDGEQGSGAGSLQPPEDGGPDPGAGMLPSAPGGGGAASWSPAPSSGPSLTGLKVGHWDAAVALSGVDVCRRRGGAGRMPVVTNRGPQGSLTNRGPLPWTNRGPQGSGDPAAPPRHSSSSSASSAAAASYGGGQRGASSENADEDAIVDA